MSLVALRPVQREVHFIRHPGRLEAEGDVPSGFVHQCGEAADAALLGRRRVMGDLAAAQSLALIRPYRQ